jgi:hypothetical protein
MTSFKHQTKRDANPKTEDELEAIWVAAVQASQRALESGDTLAFAKAEKARKAAHQAYFG